MTETNKILGPLGGDTMRVVFLYVGQGESTLVFMPDGQGGHLSMLIDCNRGVGQKGMNIAALLQDALPKNDKDRPRLDVFVNTHPHSDHLGGLKEIREVVDIEEVWHSGHNPGPDHEGAYQELNSLLRSVRARGGKETRLEGSRTPTGWGRGEVGVLSPASYVVEDIGDEPADKRYLRIHEQCAVLRISYGVGERKGRILITGDSDKTAWKRITEYHGKPEENRIQCDVFSAPHHGSYTFFKDRADDPEPYTEHLARIAPTHVVISAPDQEDSKYGHPDDDAFHRYHEATKGKVLHMGSRQWSFVVDVFPDGRCDPFNDRGALARAFPLADDSDDKKTSPITAVSNDIRRSRPMGLR
jgi:competence protein ComEC